MREAGKEAADLVGKAGQAVIGVAAIGLGTADGEIVFLTNRGGQFDLYNKSIITTI